MVVNGESTVTDMLVDHCKSSRKPQPYQRILIAIPIKTRLFVN